MSQRFGSWELRLTEEGDLNENVDDDESSQGDIVALTFCILQFIHSHFDFTAKQIQSAANWHFL